VGRGGQRGPIRRRQRHVLGNVRLPLSISPVSFSRRPRFPLLASHSLYCQSNPSQKQAASSRLEPSRTPPACFALDFSTLSSSSSFHPSSDFFCSVCRVSPAARGLRGADWESLRRRRRSSGWWSGSRFFFCLSGR
jgi:hypothetical protein